MDEPDSDLTGIRVLLTPPAVASLSRLVGLTEMSRTDTINRALILYDVLARLALAPGMGKLDLWGTGDEYLFWIIPRSRWHRWLFRYGWKSVSR